MKVDKVRCPDDRPHPESEDNVNNLDELGVKRHQAELELGRIEREFAELLQRRTDVAALVEQKRDEQRSFAMAVEMDGGKDSRALTKAVAAHAEAQARLAALAELLVVKQSEIDAAKAKLTEATRNENVARHEAAVADALLEVEKIAVEVKDSFAGLAIAQGRYLAAHKALVDLDAEVAAEAVQSVTTEALVGRLVAIGAEPLRWSGDRFGSALVVPAMALVEQHKQDAA